MLNNVQPLVINKYVALFFAGPPDIQSPRLIDELTSFDPSFAISHVMFDFNHMADND